MISLPRPMPTPSEGSSEQLAFATELQVFFWCEVPTLKVSVRGVGMRSMP